MRLTLYTDYAIRTLAILARQQPELITVASVAGELQVSHNHLMKVVNELVGAGWVMSVRGKKGGIRMAVDPASISLAQVVGRTERHPGSAACLDGSPEGCGAEGDCNIKSALSIAQNRYMEALASVTIDQLLEDASYWRQRMKAEQITEQAHRRAGIRKSTSTRLQ